MTSLQYLYAANLVILIPIAIPTLFRFFSTDENCFQESPGWRVIVGAFWFAILVLSILGLREPLRFSPVLLLQVIYKGVWLLVYAMPKFGKGKSDSVPLGITLSFVLIVLIWPWFIPWNYLLGR